MGRTGLRCTFAIAGLANAFLAGSRPVFADTQSDAFGATVTLVSDYVLRGVSQSQGNPALQAGIDYSGPFGVVAGAWASTIDLVADGAPADGADVEVDLYLARSWQLSEGVSLDTTLMRYVYPGTLPGVDYD